MGTWIQLDVKLKNWIANYIPDPHITLAYLTNEDHLSQVDEEGLMGIVLEFARNLPTDIAIGPNKIERFSKFVTVLLVNVEPDLVHMRHRLIDKLKSDAYPVDERYLWTPHITTSTTGIVVDYNSIPKPKIEVTGVSLHIGSDVITYTKESK